MTSVRASLSYYLLVAVVGLVSASIAVAFYILYMAAASLTQTALTSYSILVIIPLAFAAITIPYLLVRLFAKTKTTGSGTHAVLEAYHLTNGELDPRDTIVKPTAAMLTIGLGGSAGPEGPSLFAGGGVASMLAKRFHVQADFRRRLFVAGAAAGLAATFRTPLTAILFALEIPYKNDLDRETFIEAIIASVPAYLLSVAILGSAPFFGVVATAELSLYDIGLSLILGLICGVYSVFFTKTFAWTGNFAFKLRKRVGGLGLTAIGAAVLIISGVLSIYTIGIGLVFVQAILQGTAFSIAILIMIVLVKTFATATTLNFGGSGGLFFPTIVVGAGIGYIFAQLFNANLALVFVAVGMASLLAGTHKVLLTPVAFIVETIGGLYAIPALLASGISYLISGKHSFYPLQPKARLKTEELALERFYLKAQRRVPEELEAIKASEIMTKNPVTLEQGTLISHALDTFEGTKFRVLPVVDEHSRVVGVVNLEDLGYVDLHCRGISLSETVMHNPLLINPNTTLNEIAQLMMDTQQDHIFVIDAQEKLIGVVSGIDVVKKMMELLSV